MLILYLTFSYVASSEVKNGAGVKKSSSPLVGMKSKKQHGGRAPDAQRRLD
jgi:hypothetical protein